MRGSRYWFGLLLVLLGVLVPRALSAQELRATVRISTEDLGAVERSQFEALERQLTDLLNNQRFTGLSYAPAERIPCSFALKITEAKDADKYQAELSITASRTAYNTNYTTTTYVYRDRGIDFEYTAGQALEYNPQNLDNNLVAVFVFHALYIIAIDLDSFSPLGGDYLKDPISQLVATASNQPNWSGWKSFESDDNRGALAAALTTGVANDFRLMWYRYHRLGLDVLESKIEAGRAVLLEQLQTLKAYQREHFRSPLITLMETAKVDELVNIYGQAPTEERRQMRELLSTIFPTRTDSWSKLSN
ncbi:MAG: DUF4835 family protein [Porphyromonadaceae bacterium]|nr:DUF4835 family protein [Porphyromonadaceae bacterium]